jgi:hypothetical protein
MEAKANKFAKIYGIVDSATGRVVYVGKANDVQVRWKGHLADCVRKDNRLYRWMRQQFEENQPVSVVELASAISEDWQALEVAMIAQYRDDGDLLNMADGGNQPYIDIPTCRKNAVKLNERRKNDPLFRRAWEIKRAMGGHLRFLRREGADPEMYNKVVAKLKYAAQKRPDLFACWSTL